MALLPPRLIPPHRRRGAVPAACTHECRGRHCGGVHPRLVALDSMPTTNVAYGWPGGRAAVARTENR